MLIRNYKPADYDQIATLYKQNELYGGQFDENRDSKEQLTRVTQRDPEAILVCEVDSKIVGTISLIEDGRIAWLFRFAVLPDYPEAAKLLFEKASAILKSRGHNQVLVYAPAGSATFSDRYQKYLGFEKGSDYTCYWKNI